MAEDLLAAPGVELLTAGDIGKETLAGGKDPHVWLSPVEMIAMADAAAGTIETALPELAPTVESNLAQLRTSLEGLDARYRTELTNCDTRVLVTSHAAFGYLADAYGLQQVPIAGVTPEDEPDPKTLQSIAEIARQDNVKTVFFEDALPSDLSQTVADEIGAKVSLLSALEVRPASLDRPRRELPECDGRQPRPDREGPGVPGIVIPGGAGTSPRAPVEHIRRLKLIGAVGASTRRGRSDPGSATGLQRTRLPPSGNRHRRPRPAAASLEVRQAGRRDRP